MAITKALVLKLPDFKKPFELFTDASSIGVGAFLNQDRYQWCLPLARLVLRKWAEIIPLKKTLARVIADTFFDNYISRFGAPVKLISDNGPQFISDIFEHLSDRLGKRHVKTVVYRPQKLVMVSDGNEFAVGNIERLFDEARRNTKAKHEKWEKYNRRRRDV
ncbi:hypothetical protein TNCV_2413431 [Trichonephila clavipes]|nr:hypothetical protein TNCV_2413431 [Trichonephila clavipes]